MSTITYNMLQDVNLWEIRLFEVTNRIRNSQRTYKQLKRHFPDYEWKGDLKLISKLSVRKLWIEYTINKLKN